MERTGQPDKPVFRRHHACGRCGRTGAWPSDGALTRPRAGGGPVTAIYLDANATEPLRPAARAAMLAAFEVTGNPSSVHGAGRSARRILEDAREAIAGRFGGRAADLVFTSGGTEANALAVHAFGRNAPGGGRRLIIGATEHDAIRATATGADIVPVDPNGVADLATLERLLQGG